MVSVCLTRDTLSNSKVLCKINLNQCISVFIEDEEEFILPKLYQDFQLDQVTKNFEYRFKSAKVHLVRGTRYMIVVDEARDANSSTSEWTGHIRYAL